MFEQIAGYSALIQILLYSTYFAVFVFLAVIFRFFLRKIVTILANKTSTKLDENLVSTLDKPVMVAIILGSIYLATILFRTEPVLRRYTDLGAAIGLSLLGIYLIVALFDVLARWYSSEVLKARKEVGFSGEMISVFRVTVYLTGVLLAVLISLRILGIGAAPIAGWLGGHGWRIAFILVFSLAIVVLVGEIVPKVVVRSLSRASEETKEECFKRGNTLSRVLVNSAQIVVIVLAGFMILPELEINILPVLTGVGVAGIAIGFGAQSLVKDIVNGLFIIFENQYRVGDVIKVADVAGIVEDINLRRTMLRDLDGIVHTVPNGQIGVSSNFTKEWSRVNLNISVAYGEDLDRVIAVIDKVGKELAEDPEWAPSILTPPKVNRVDNLGDSGVELKILGETKPMRQWDVMGQLRLRLKKAFDIEGIEIPWPHSKVYFGNTLFGYNGESSTMHDPIRNSTR